MAVIIVMILFVVLCLSLCLLFNIPNALWRYYNLCKAMKVIPSLPCHWFMGHINFMKLILAGNMPDEYKNWRVKNKIKISCQWLGPFKASVILSHPSYVKQILKNPKADNMYSLFEPWLGRGLILESGQRWLKNRRLLTPAFHFDILKPYVHVYNDCTDILLAKWEKCASDGTPVSVQKTISLLTLDVILRCACSYYSNCQDIDENNRGDEYVQGVMSICTHCRNRAFSPILTYSKFLFMYCTSQGWDFRHALDTVHKHSEKVIEERRKKFEETKKETTLGKSMDFLDTLLFLNNEEDPDHRMNNEDIRNEVDTFVFGGFDTITTSLTWTLYLLAKFPAHQTKCREEVRDVLRGRTYLDYDDLPKLQYTLCCLKESMRLFPPVYKIYKQLTQDTTIGEYYVPKEAKVGIDIAGIHRNPEVWEKPLNFLPLRFHPDHVKEQRDPFSFLPFSAGPRNCIGQNFAFNEQRVVLASILNRFYIDIADERIKKSLPCFPNIILRPKEELFLTLKPAN